VNKFLEFAIMLRRTNFIMRCIASSGSFISNLFFLKCIFSSN